MTRSQFAELRTLEISRSVGFRAPFLDRPFDHIGAQRTSQDVCREACAIHAFKRRMPASEKALYIVGALGFVAAIVFNNWS